MSVASTTKLPATASRSRELFERASAVMPRGNSRHSVFFSPHPLYCVGGLGSRVFDADGVERIDFVNNYSSLIHGHGHPAILDALQAQAALVMAVGLPTEREIELAELLCERIQSVEQVRFTNSGTEAVMMAVKAARAFTGRPAIAKFEGCYHGTYDPVEVSQAPSQSGWGPPDEPNSVALSHGTPAGIIADTVVLPFDDPIAARRILEKHSRRLAGIMIDLTPAHLGYIEMSEDMVGMLQAYAARSGALLIADEVYSLRLDYRGAQHRFGLKPDLTAMGKIIGGGLPIGAVGGSAEIMTVFDPMPDGPAVVHGGTYNANPLSTATGLASMRILTPEAIARLDDLGDRLRGDLRQLCASRGWEVTIGGLGSLVSIAFGNGPLRNYRDWARLKGHGVKVEAFHRAMLDRGILLASQGLAVLSTAMDTDDVDAFTAAADAAFRDVL